MARLGRGDPGSGHCHHSSPFGSFPGPRHLHCVVCTSESYGENVSRGQGGPLTNTSLQELLLVVELLHAQAHVPLQTLSVSLP